MKTVLKGLTLAAALTGAAQAATSVTTTTVNLRRLPAMSGAVVGVVPANTLLTVACRRDWCRTSYQGRGGYIARTLLRPVTRSAPLSGKGVSFYASCDAARAAGVAPIRLGRPGYRSALDTNHNGLACESSER